MVIDMQIKKIIRGFVLFSMIVLLAAGADSFHSKADEISDIKQSIKDKQNALDKAANEKKQLQSGLSDIKSIIAGLEQDKKDLSAYINKLDTSLSQAQAKILELNETIKSKETEIAKTEAELEQAIANEEEQYASMKSRVKFMYEKGDNFYLELMLSAKTFGELLNKADYIEQLSKYDREMLDKFQATREYVELCKQQLEAEKEILDEAKKDVEAEQASLEQMIAEKEKQMAAYEQNINDQQALAQEYEDEIAQQTAEIKALEDAVAAEKARLNSKTTQKYDGGMFAWPAPSYTRISSDYGTRMHPTLHVEKFHSGIDLAAPGGSPILAAYNGTVVAAAYSTSMGNYVMIDHGDNLYTIYMHASALYVSKGQTVSKGQKIAAVGTTGRSTGNHLHFGVRLNGNYVSPWNYLSK